MYFTCKKTPYPELAFREYQEPDNMTEPDDGVDGQFGVFCEDAGFNPRPWPKEEECVKVPTCKELPTPGIKFWGKNWGKNQLNLTFPPYSVRKSILIYLVLLICLAFTAPSKKYRPLSVDFVSENEVIYYECADSNSILDDDSGRNFFPLLCKGDDTLGHSVS